MTSSVPESTPSAQRPLGLLRPAQDRARRAVKALDENRLADAERHIEAIADDDILSRGWQLLLRGRLKVQRGQLSEADPWFLQAAAVAFIGATDASPTSLSHSLRLCAAALQDSGWVARRQDRPHDAYRTHLASWKLREDCGSWEEMWETALNLGLDAGLARRHERAESWYRRAIELASLVEPHGPRCQALAWSNLSSSLADEGRFIEAVEAARQAREQWWRHDREAVSAVKADMLLGAMLLRQAEQAGEDPALQEVLREAIGWLAGAREALLAFGDEYAVDAQACLDQQELAERLLACRTLTP